jgi:hypothetical protein
VGHRGRLGDAAAAALVGDPLIEITLSVLTPYLAYWPPEELGGSGVARDGDAGSTSAGTATC